VSLTEETGRVQERAPAARRWIVEHDGWLTRSAVAVGER
jgi:hypothetical protein